MLRPTRLDGYMLRLFVGPLVLAVGTLLLAQILERLLRLFDLAGSAGAPLSSVLAMAGNLVPHYLGMALPMGFTAAIFMAAARLCDDNELDVMLATGHSITRIAAPYFGVALLLAVMSFFLFGRLQPLTRYGYHLAVSEALQTRWSAKIEENRFIVASENVVFRANRVHDDGRSLEGVFVSRRDGTAEETVTAAKGRLVPSDDGLTLALDLDDGRVVREDNGRTDATMRFGSLRINQDFTPKASDFRPRGDSVRERTFEEIWASIRAGNADAEERAEFHSRLARVLTLPVLPLLALPLGMAAKRGRRAPGVVFATLVLLAYNHALQFGESLGETGRLPPALAIWTPFVVFALLSAWLFRGSLRWPGDNPVTRALSAIESGFEGLKPRRRGKPKKPGTGGA